MEEVRLDQLSVEPIVFEQLARLVERAPVEIDTDHLVVELGTDGAQRLKVAAGGAEEDALATVGSSTLAVGLSPIAHDVPGSPQLPVG